MQQNQLAVMAFLAFLSWALTNVLTALLARSWANQDPTFQIIGNALWWAIGAVCFYFTLHKCTLFFYYRGIIDERHRLQQRLTEVGLARQTKDPETGEVTTIYGCHRCDGEACTCERKAV